jgi:HK97 gp10 family phage protein
MKVTFRVEGLKDCEDALKALPAATGKNVLRRVLLEAGAPIASVARSLAPKLTGRLSVSIIVGTRLSKRQRKIANDTKSYAEVYVGPAPYPRAHIQEFGSSDVPPQPYMRPAVDATGNRVIEIFKDRLWEETRKAMARFERKAARLAAKIKAGK